MDSYTKYKIGKFIGIALIVAGFSCLIISMQLRANKLKELRNSELHDAYYQEGIKKVQMEAVQAGKAEWIPNIDGTTTFRWMKDPVPTVKTNWSENIIWHKDIIWPKEDSIILLER